jgi:WD40 repeat protein
MIGEKNWPFRGPCFLPDGKTIAFKYRGIRLFDTRTREEVGNIPDMRSGDALAATPDSSQIVFGDQEGALHVWDLQSRKEIQTLHGPKEYITGLAFSRNGRLLASAGSSFDMPWETAVDRAICLWDFHTGNKRKQFTGDWETPSLLGFLPDNKRLISFHDPDSYTPTLRMWSADADKAVSTWTPKENACAVAMTVDGKWIATGDISGKIRIWELATVMSHG